MKFLWESNTIDETKRSMEESNGTTTFRRRHNRGSKGKGHRNPQKCQPKEVINLRLNESSEIVDADINEVPKSTVEVLVKYQSKRKRKRDRSRRNKRL